MKTEDRTRGKGVVASCCIATVVAMLPLLIVGLCGAAATQASSFDRKGRETFRFGGTVQQVLGDRQGGALLLMNAFRGLGQGIIRLHPNGTIDRAFGQRGFSQVPWRDGAVRKDGRILLVADSNDRPRKLVTVYCLLPNGRFDRSFGRRGAATIDFGEPLQGAGVITTTAAGKIIVGGFRATRLGVGSHGGGDEIGVVARLDRRGSADRTFSGDGVLPLPGFTEVDDVADPGSGGALVAGEGALLRLRNNGALDKSFGTRGSLVPGLSDGDDPYVYFQPTRGIDVRSDGRITLVGTTTDEALGYENYGGAAVRYLPNGERDRSYGDAGVARFSFRSIDYTLPEAFVAGRDGSLLIAANYYVSENESHGFGAVRLRPDGSLDPRFGDLGQAMPSFPRNDWVSGVALSGKYAVFAGYSQAGGGNLTTVARVGLRR